MADKVPLKGLFDGSGNVTGLAEYRSADGDTLGVIHGGTGLTTFGKGSVLVANSADTLTALDGGGSNDAVLFYTASSDTISWATSLDGGTF